MQGKLRIAEELGDPAIVKMSRKQIEDVKANIDDAIGNYNSHLDDLGKRPPTLVQQEFDRYSQALKEKGESQKLKALAVMRGHVKQHADGGRNLEAEALREFCAARR